MKRMFKISLGILIIGIILMIVGFAGHGMKNISFKGTTPVIEKRVTKRLSTDKEFTKINLTSSTANVLIKPGTKFSISYQGSNARLPKVRVTNQVATINQTGSNGMFFSYNDGDDIIVITVPKGSKLSGKLDIADGDLSITNVDLDNMDVNAADGDIVYNNLTVTGGKTTLGDGDFTSNKVTFKGHYTVKTDDGNNKVIASYADGFILHTDDGDNKLDGVDHGTEDLQQNESAANLLRLESNDGDNSVINIKAVQ